MDKLVVTRRQDKVCTAVISEGRISQLLLEPDGAASLLGNIYIGKVQKVVGNINAAFIDLGPGMTGYYSLGERTGAGKLKAGDEVVVQVSRDGVKTKAPVLTENLSFTGRYCVLTAGKSGIGFSAKISDPAYKSRLRPQLEAVLADGIAPKAGAVPAAGIAPKAGAVPADGTSLGVIVRTNAVKVEDHIILKELGALKAAWSRLKAEASCRTCYSCLYRALPGYITAIRDSFSGSLEQIITDVPAYYEELKRYLELNQPEDAEHLVFYEDPLLPLAGLYSLEKAFEKALSKNVWLKSGGYLVIEPTEAMTVIDVNTGKYSGKKKMQETICKINMEAAGEIGRQLRLRNLSGIIIVDFIDMDREEDRRALLAYLGEIVSKDPVKTTVVDMTRLNLVELTRKKVRKPLHEQI